MYEYIRGTLIQITPTTAVIETAGVGWFVNVSVQTSASLTGQGVGSEVKLLVHYHVSQDQAPVLYGFASEDERSLFRLLISISGIGPNTARIMLSTYTALQLSKFILTGNVRAIQKTKGIGQRTAERVVLELKDKVKVGADEGGMSESPVSTIEMEAVTALTVLGFPKAAAEKAVHKVFAADKTMSTEELIRKSLSEI